MPDTSTDSQRVLINFRRLRDLPSLSGSERKVADENVEKTSVIPHRALQPVLDGVHCCQGHNAAGILRISRQELLHVERKVVDLLVSHPTELVAVCEADSEFSAMTR